MDVDEYKRLVSSLQAKVESIDKALGKNKTILQTELINNVVVIIARINEYDKKIRKLRDEKEKERSRAVEPKGTETSSVESNVVVISLNNDIGKLEAKLASMGEHEKSWNDFLIFLRSKLAAMKEHYASVLGFADVVRGIVNKDPVVGPMLMESMDKRKSPRRRGSAESVGSVSSYGGMHIDELLLQIEDGQYYVNVNKFLSYI